MFGTSFEELGSMPSLINELRILAWTSVMESFFQDLIVSKITRE